MPAESRDALGRPPPERGPRDESGGGRLLWEACGPHGRRGLVGGEEKRSPLMRAGFGEEDSNVLLQVVWSMSRSMLVTAASMRSGVS